MTNDNTTAHAAEAAHADNLRLADENAPLHVGGGLADASLAEPVSQPAAAPSAATGEMPSPAPPMMIPAVPGSNTADPDAAGTPPERGGNPLPTSATASEAVGPEFSEAVGPEFEAEERSAGELAEPDASVDAAPSDPRSAIGLPAEEATLFHDLGLSDEVLRAIDEMGYRHPTPIQAQAIPVVLMGRDVLGVAQTGTGKTAGFTLPMLDILSGSRARARMPRSLILEPTRELALQVAENFLQYGKYLKLNHALLIGGESLSDQRDALMRGVDVLIATPGRLLDLFERGGLLLTDARLLVIDEADRMLDMGFIPDVERIVSLLPHNRQTLFFSATMAPEIRRLADAFLQNPKTISVSRPASVATTIVTGLALVAAEDKREALRRLIRSEEVQNALIFCNRKRDVDILFKSLTKHGLSAGALHGDLPQSVRFATLEKFKAGEIRLLVCSDVAARGIDIGGLSHVFNFDVPHHAEDYVHRIGRTGRAGREGHAYTLATPEDRLAVEAIEKLTGGPIPRVSIPGLAEVSWAEEDGRKRRGRRGASAASSAAPAGRSGRGSTKQPEREAGKQLEREAGAGAGRAAPEDARGGEARRPRDGAGTRTERSRRSGARATRTGGAEAPVGVPPGGTRDLVTAARAESVAREEPPFREARRSREQRGSRDDIPRPTRDDRFARRELRRREDDLGPPVLGFGDDVPAFMLLPFRHRATFEREDVEG